jgi:pathogenesis-related protein 1
MISQNNNLLVTIIMSVALVAAAAILILPSSVLQLSHAQTSADFQNTILSIHNRERALVGVPALKWNNDLAAAAQPWATHLATLGLICTPNNCYIPHDPSRGSVGENIAMSLAPTQQQVEDWAYEKHNYHGGPYNPQPSDPVQGVYNPAIDHYTQMVWRTTTEIGCARANENENGVSGMEFLVCRYTPPGNILGQNPY